MDIYVQEFKYNQIQRQRVYSVFNPPRTQSLTLKLKNKTKKKSFKKTKVSVLLKIKKDILTSAILPL